MITDLFQDIFGYMMIPAFIASYILRAISIHTIAQRRQTDRVWFAWVPILNQFLLGKVSDQYSLTVKGKRTHQRWWLLGLAAVSNTLSFVSNVMMATVVGEAILGGSSLGILWFGVHYEEIMEKLMSAFLLILLAGAVAAVPMRIVRYVALYRVYESCLWQNLSCCSCAERMIWALPDLHRPLPPDPRCRLTDGPAIREITQNPGNKSITPCRVVAGEASIKNSRGR